MMDEKRLEEEYRNLKRQAAPDLWDRIDANLKDHPERNADMKTNQAAQEEQEKKNGQKKEKQKDWGKVRRYYGAAAAAAAVVVLAAVRPVMEGGFAGGLSKSQSAATAAAAAEGVMTEETMAEIMAGETMAACEEGLSDAGTDIAFGSFEAEAPAAAAGDIAPGEAAAGAAAAGAGAARAAAPGAAPSGAAALPGAAAAGAAASGDAAPGAAVLGAAVQEAAVSKSAAPEFGRPQITDSPAVNDFNTEEYSYLEENDFCQTAKEPVSTFSVDVDTAAYSNIRRMIYAGRQVPKDAVRIEEMINYFHYDYPEPKKGEPFSVTTEYASCPWNPDSRLLMIGLQAEKIDFSEKPASNLVFLLDVSGSMADPDKLPLVQKSFALLAENLTEHDRVSIVTYSGSEAVVLDGVSGDQTSKIVDALEGLTAQGSTAGEAGIRRAYELAQKHYVEGGNNRVIMATDGDLNVGISSEGELTRLIEEQKKSGVHLSVLGVGSGNLKDNKLEALADHGDGNYNYIDSVLEAKKVLVDEMGGTLVTVAKDVKLQLEFNPEQVAQYRLIGYENRVLRREDFDNDRADAGEIGAGHTVTALYEIVPADADSRNNSPGLKYQQSAKTTGSSELLTVSLRYKEPDSDTSLLLQYPVEAGSFRTKASDNLTFAAAVAEFGMVLRDSAYKGDATYGSVHALAESCIGADSDDHRKEFLRLVETAENNAGHQSE